MYQSTMMGSIYLAALVLALGLCSTQGHGLKGHYRARGPLSYNTKNYRHGPFYKVVYGYSSSHKAPSTYEHQSYVAHTYKPKAEEKQEITYKQPTKAYKPIVYKAHAECQERGQYLRDPLSQCKYRRCVVTSEPWEEYGEIPLDIMSGDCAPGTAVPHDYTTGSTNPCTIHSESCLGSKPAPKTKEPEPEPSYKPVPSNKAPKTSVSECHERGQYLADPENKCNYRRCVVLSEPWQQNGAIPLDIITDQCPAGTAVPHGYHSGKDNPCSVFDDTCGEKASPYETPMEEEEPQTHSAPEDEEEKEEEVSRYTPPEPVMTKAEPTMKVFKYVPVMYKPMKECHERGQYLPDPQNQCKYRRCVVMNEPWEQDGEIPLDIISKDCAPGTAVPHAYKGGNTPPCTIFDDTCKAPNAMVHDPPTEAPNTYEAPAEEEEVEETMVHPEEPVVMEQPKYAPAPYSPPKMKECQVPGQYLPDTSSKCKYRRCVIMSEPWQQNGQIPLDIITENCAPKTSVPDHYTGGFENPCTKINDECQGPAQSQAQVHYAPQPMEEEMEKEVEEESHQPPQMMKEPRPVMMEQHPMMKEQHPMMMEQHPMMMAQRPMMKEQHPMMMQQHPLMMEQRPVMKEEPQPAPGKGCQHRGEHLADPTNRCMYKRCVVMSEPWAVNGQIPLDVVSKHCARGSAVPNDYKGGYANPCTARDQTCTGGIEVKTHKGYQ